MYETLTVNTVADYVRQSPVMGELFHADDELAVEDLAEGGNINLIFRVYATADRERSVLVKQALPHARRYPEFKIPLDRAKFEYELLALEERYAPGLTPKLYLHDDEMFVNLMEDLNNHLVMREGLSKGIHYPKFAKDTGHFMAHTLFYTSDLYLSSAEKKAMVVRFVNPVLCKVTEDLFFNEPCKPNDNNRWTSPQLDDQVQAIYNNPALHGEMLVMKEKFMCNAQALVHGDLHTGSVLINPDDTRFIDPEFAFYGPIAFDIGSMLGNLVIGYAAQEYYAESTSARSAYRNWIIEAIRQIWHIFDHEFRRLWEEEGNRDEWASAHFQNRYMRQIFEDALGNAAAEMFRRTIGLAWVDDFTGISDQDKRAAAESIVLRVAQSWLLDRDQIGTIDDALEHVQSSRSD